MKFECFVFGWMFILVHCSSQGTKERNLTRTHSNHISRITFHPSTRHHTYSALNIKRKPIHHDPSARSLWMGRSQHQQARAKNIYCDKRVTVKEFPQSALRERTNVRMNCERANTETCDAFVRYNVHYIW